PAALASGGSRAVERDYVMAPPAPARQSTADAHAKSEGCLSCHTATDSASMHASPAVILGCTDCHGGDAGAFRPDGAERGDDRYVAAMERAHVLPRYPDDWHRPSSANPERTYTLLNREAREFIRFTNPS